MTDFIFLQSKITADSDCSYEIKRCWLIWRKVMTNISSVLKSRGITLLTKVFIVKAIVFPKVMYRSESWTDQKEGWKPKNCGFWFVMLEKSLESSLESKEIKLVNPKGNQHWVFVGKTDAEASILWPHDAKLTHWKRPWYWERLRAGGEGGDRGWDGWIASLTQWTWKC